MMVFVCTGHAENGATLITVNWCLLWGVGGFPLGGGQDFPRLMGQSLYALRDRAKIHNFPLCTNQELIILHYAFQVAVLAASFRLPPHHFSTPS